MRDLRYPHLHDNIGCPHCQFSLSELQLLVAKELIQSLWRPTLSFVDAQESVWVMDSKRG
jgi:hypothetical protein